MRIDIKSFAIGDGIPPSVDFWGGVYMFDCRMLPDPYWDENLRAGSGRDEGVKDFFANHAEEVGTFLEPVEAVVRRALTTAGEAEWETITVLFACVGGRHRSVYCAERLADRLKDVKGVEIDVEHCARKDWENK